MPYVHMRQVGLSTNCCQASHVDGNGRVDVDGLAYFVRGRSSVAPVGEERVPRRGESSLSVVFATPVHKSAFLMLTRRPVEDRVKIRCRF